MDHQDEYSATTVKKSGKQHNILPLWGNESTMNLNPLILANIQGSSYFKVHLFKLKTYHEVVDEIYYQVKHLEPWERGSRKTAGQTGMCGGVRGVGAGGIVSTAFCLLYKLYTLRLTRKQVNGLLTHTDSPYIRALGFMYIRYTQPPNDLYDWYEDYLQDEEEIDAKAGGGQVMTIGQMVYQFLTKLDWFSTLFPRIPVPIKKQIDKKLEEYARTNNVNFHVSQQQRRISSPARSNYYSSNEYRDSSNRGKYSSNTSVNDKERERESRDLERRRREERRSFERREREREKIKERELSRDHYSSSGSSSHHQRDLKYRDDYYKKDRRREVNEKKYERSRSRDYYDHKEKEKHKRKHKTADREKSKSRERSRSKERRAREKDYYRNDRESSENYKDRDYDKRYR